MCDLPIFLFRAEDDKRGREVTGVRTCAHPSVAEVMRVGCRFGLHGGLESHEIKAIGNIFRGTDEDVTRVVLHSQKFNLFAGF